MPRSKALSVADVRSIARSHTEAMVHVLVGIAQQPKAPAAARVSAASILLDRGWGKPDQAHVGADGGDIKVTIRQLIEHIDVQVVELKAVASTDKPALPHLNEREDDAD